MPDVFGMDIAMEAANQSVMMPLCTPFNVGSGNNEVIPFVGTRSVTARTRGTDDGNAIVASALNDSSRNFSKRTVYDAIKWDYMVDNDMDPIRLNSWLDGEKQQSAEAHANDFDEQTLGLYASASSSVGGATDVTLPLLKEAIKKLRVANAKGQYNIVLPETQWDHLADIDELTRFDIRGEGDTITNKQAFRLHGVNIWTTNNVPTSGGVAHGLAFASSGIVYRLKTFLGVDDWNEKKDMAFYINTWADYRYAYTFANQLVDFQVNEA